MSREPFPRRRAGATRLLVPTLGFGGAPLGGLYARVDPAEASAAVEQALDAGIAYFDTAPFYGFGRSERLIGDRLRGRGYVLSTKAGRLLRPGAHPAPETLGWPDPLPFHPVYDYSYDGIMRSFEDSLQRLGLDRIDMLFAHDVGAMTHGDGHEAHFAELRGGGYRALDALRSGGAVQGIGVGVNEVAVCLAALEIGDWDVFLLAGRYTLLEQSPLDDLLPECLARGTSIVVGGPYNSGILAGGDTWNYARAPGSVVARVRELRRVARDHGVPLPAAALRFPLAHPAVVSVIPGMRTPAELADTLAWTRNDVPAAFWSDLKSRGLLRPDSPVPETNPFEGGGTAP